MFAVCEGGECLGCGAEGSGGLHEGCVGSVREGSVWSREELGGGVCEGGACLGCGAGRGWGLCGGCWGCGESLGCTGKGSVEV